MKKNIIKFILSIVGVFILVVIYLSTFGLETEKFNTQIKNKVIQVNSKLNLDLKKIKLTLDLLNLKINAKTIGSKIIFKDKEIRLESIKTQISIVSIIKNKFVSSNLKISTKSILLKDLISFLRAVSNKTEFYYLDNFTKKGYVVVDLELDFDENGKIKDNFQISGSLKNGKLILLKKYNIEKINFFLNVRKKILSFNEIYFTINNINFFSDKLKVTKNKQTFLFEGIIENKASTLNNELLNLIKLNFENLELKKTNFSSKNNLSFKIDNNFKLKDLVIDSEIQIDEFAYKKPNLFKDSFSEINDIVFFKGHKIKASYKKDDLFLKGSGTMQLQKVFDKVEYSIRNKNKNFNIISNLDLSELRIKNKKFFQRFFPNINKNLNLKDHQIRINYTKDKIFFEGSGKIQLEKEYDKINYSISKIGSKFEFDTKLDLDKTLLVINSLNYKKNEKFKTQLKIIGNYEKNNRLNLNEVSIIGKNNKIILNNLSLNKENKVIKVDKFDLDYFDIENKKNKLILKRNQKNSYELNGSIFNANFIISDLLESTSDKPFNILKNDIELIININEVFIDDKNIVKNFKGSLNFVNNEITKANIQALFKNNKDLNFTINTNNNEKVTTFYSSKAKPFVKRYKFIKGFEEGDLNFNSSKKNGISNSLLVIDNFKVQEIPILAKLLTLASLQGIADLLTGEGIRFTDFEMKFSNDKKLMTIDELYAIGPAISILMDGYVQSDELISLRGTLVPATTINRTIASIPLVGDFLIGKKVGEGIFGVSFKIKGPPKDLKTTVNPVKTLTPRFITRTLEKIKKN